MMIIEKGLIKGLFTGFRNKHTVFEFDTGGRWRQNEDCYGVHFVFMPDAQVVKHATGYLLYVDGIAETVAVCRA